MIIFNDFNKQFTATLSENFILQLYKLLKVFSQTKEVLLYKSDKNFARQKDGFVNIMLLTYICMYVGKDNIFIIVFDILVHILRAKLHCIIIDSSLTYYYNLKIIISPN